MDGATNELASAGYGRASELRHCGEAIGRLAAIELIDHLEADKRGCFRHVERALRGLPAHAHDWPAWCWEQYASGDGALADEMSDRDVMTMRDAFVAECALRLDDAGYDCR